MLNAGWRLMLLVLMATARNAYACYRTIAFAPAIVPDLWLRIVRERSTSSCLFMGKGLNSRNKQIELAKKLAIAKKQQDPDQDKAAVTDNDSDIQLRKDREQFAQLLKTSKVPNEDIAQPPERKPARICVPVPSASKGINKVTAKNLKKRKKAKKEEKENGSDVRSDDDPFVEGNIAKRRDFEKLVSVETSKTLGPINAAKLVPWVPPYKHDYLVVVADPREQSGDLRQTIQFLTSNLAPEIIEQLIVISADHPTETSRWMSRANIASPLRVYSDQNLEWMKKYSAVGDDRWSMCLIFILQNGRIQKIEREVAASQASRIVMDILGSLSAI